MDRVAHCHAQCRIRRYIIKLDDSLIFYINHKYLLGWIKSVIDKYAYRAEFYDENKQPDTTYK